MAEEHNDLAYRVAIEVMGSGDFPYVATSSEEQAGDRAMLLMKAGYDDLPERTRKKLSLRDIDVLTRHLRWHFMQAEHHRRAALAAVEGRS